VIDRADDAVLRLSAGGREIDRIGGPGGPFDFDDGESAVAVGASGDVYVLGDDPEGERSVWAFDGTGRPLWRIDAPGDACGLTVGSDGDLWVADPDSGLSRFALGGRPGERPRPAGEPVAVDDLDSAERCGLAAGGGGGVYVATDAEYLSTTASVFVQLGTVLGFLIVPLVIAGRGGAGIAGALRRLGLRRFRVLTALKWMAAAIGVYLLFAIVYSGIFGEPEQEDIAESFGAVPVQVLLIVFAAAVSEEVCFRGMLFGGLRERLPMLAAGLLSGAVFGALHALTGLSAVPPLIAFGLVMAVLYEKTGSIVPGILLHMLNNSAALLAQ
jgi:membrane protease YdiL (CAAX protease family)